MEVKHGRCIHPWSWSSPLPEVWASNQQPSTNALPWSLLTVKRDQPFSHVIAVETFGNYIFHPWSWLYSEVSLLPSCLHLATKDFRHLCSYINYRAISRHLRLCHWLSGVESSIHLPSHCWPFKQYKITCKFTNKTQHPIAILHLLLYSYAMTQGIPLM